MGPFDQAAILASGQALVPDWQRRDLEMRLGAAQTQNFAAEARSRHAEVDEEEAFRAQFEDLQRDPSPQKWAMLAARFPKAADKVKTAYEMQQGPALLADQTRKSERFIAAQGGKWDLVERSIAAEIEAQRQSGEVDELDIEVLNAIRSGDPAQRDWAMRHLGTEAAMALGADKFANNFEAFGLKPESDPTVQREYEWRVGQFGQAAADAWLRAQELKVVPVGEGQTAQIVDPTLFVPGVAAAGGSAPAPAAPPQKAARAAPARPSRGTLPIGNAAEVAQQLFPGVVVTDNRRDPNSSLGKKNPDSWHVRSGAAIDVRPVPGMTYDQYVQRYRDAGYEIIEERDEVTNPSGHATGPHWHVVLGKKKGAQQVAGGGAVRVRSLQEARALPKGTTFITPDGRRKVR